MTADQPGFGHIDKVLSNRDQVDSRHDPKECHSPRESSEWPQARRALRGREGGGIFGLWRLRRECLMPPTCKRHRTVESSRFGVSGPVSVIQY